MSEWTQAQLDALIVCPKRITVPPKTRMEQARGYWRNGMDLEAVDGSRRFRAYMRVNDAFPENFSIGLIVLPVDGAAGDLREEIHLLRCNGPHEEVGSKEARPGMPGWHFGYHIHRAKADNMDAGMRAERGAETTSEYGSFSEALSFFVKTCGVQGAKAYLSEILAKRLFDQTEVDEGG